MICEYVELETALDKFLVALQKGCPGALWSARFRFGITAYSRTFTH